MQRLENMEGIYGTYTGIPIIITDKRKQKRIHRKKRINKKWAKRYGFIGNDYSYIEDDKAIMFKGKIYMSEKTFLKLKSNINLSSSISKYFADNMKIIEY